MLSLGAVSFAAPWALLGLLALPALWWLLRVTPPPPKRISFPPVRLLAGLVRRAETPARTPPWLVALRLLFLGLLVGAAAHPLLEAGDALRGEGPVYLMVDNGWASARDWPARAAFMDDVLERAKRDGRSVVLLSTAPPRPPSAEILDADAALKAARALAPRPWPTDRKRAVQRLERFAAANPGQVFWLTDGLAQKGDEDILATLRPLGPLTIVADPPGKPALILRPPALAGTAMEVRAARLGGGAPEMRLVARDADGAALDRRPLAFEGGEAKARIDLPSELRNRLARLEIEGAEGAGPVALLDERWRRRSVGLADAGAGGERPYTGPLYYLVRALEPHADVRRGSLETLLDAPPPVMVSPSPAPMSAATRNKLSHWVNEGGVLVRFAGEGLDPRDSLLPTPLRGGERALGGALTWEKPKSLAPFPERGPFQGLAVPKDVRVKRQVLALPTLELPERTWAALDDGTPLVTAAKRKAGRLVLVHVTANAAWSDLPLSVLFVDMMKRLASLGLGEDALGGSEPLAPRETLDGFGRAGPPPPEARPVPPTGPVRVGPGHPPGLYGTGAGARAVNLSAELESLAPFALDPDWAVQATFGAKGETDLRPWALAAALLLFAVDLAAGLRLRGLLALLFLFPFAAEAQVPEAALATRLAYVLTGDPVLDETSRAGLEGLGVILQRRTAVELGPPVGVDPVRDDLAFYPIVYWPVGEGLSADGLAGLTRFMDGGGMVLADTKEPGRVLDWPDAPELAPAPDSHVLGRAFYLLRDFPGRWAGGTVWLDQPGERVNDGAPRLVVGGHDWAGAWAMDELQRHMFPVSPGGERQREMAIRFGVNLVMVALTGNYKADQVHLKAIMERLKR